MATPNRASRLVAAVGTFDGVHLGHRTLLAEVVGEARRDGLTPAVVTFSNHPLTYLRPEMVPMLLASPRLKEQLLRDAGIERVVLLPFDASVAALTAKQFIARLRDEYGVSRIVLGFNTSMGCDRVSRLDEFEQIGESLGVEIMQAGEFCTDMIEEPVSSSTIRRLLMAGGVEMAAKLLARPYMLQGCVVHGKALGRRLGYPTANVEPAPEGQLVPAVGVYACHAMVGERRYKAMVNIGNRPTVDERVSALSIEAHIMDYDGDLYGLTVTLEFIKRLRDEQRFGSVDELVEQLRRDELAAREALA